MSAPRLRAAANPLRPRRAARLMALDPAAGRFLATRPMALPTLLRAGDLLVVNDAATLPASLPTVDGLELRLLGEETDGRWWAVLFGACDWRLDTDLRPAPARLDVGHRLVFGGGLSAEVEARAPAHPRLLRVRFDRGGPALSAAFYAAGRPVQYSYLDQNVPLEAVQNLWARRPWALEMPSAGRLLSWEVLSKLHRAGVALAPLTHAAGLSATGDPVLDAALPLPERYEIPAATAQAIDATRAAGGRVIAVGTSVVRALEGDALAGSPGRGRTALRLRPGDVITRVDGILSNLHEPGESHFELLSAFAPRPLLVAALDAARADGWLAHEFGDGLLILGGLGPAAQPAANQPA